jgi:hypothetical protein
MFCGRFVYFIANLYIHIVTIYGNLVYISPRFGMLQQEKSGNLAPQMAFDVALSKLSCSQFILSDVS